MLHNTSDGISYNNTVAWLRGTRNDPPTLDELRKAEVDFKALKARVAELERIEVAEKIQPASRLGVCKYNNNPQI